MERRFSSLSQKVRGNFLPSLVRSESLMHPAGLLALSTFQSRAVSVHAELYDPRGELVVCRKTSQYQSYQDRNAFLLLSLPRPTPVQKWRFNPPLPP